MTWASEAVCRFAIAQIFSDRPFCDREPIADTPLHDKADFSVAKMNVAYYPCQP